MKATELLAHQHRHVEALFERLESSQGDEELVLELATHLAAHMTIEQELFYPAVRAVKPHLVDEGFEEHAVAELALKRLLATDADDRSFSARVATLKELVEHHVKEEENELFPAVEGVLDGAELEELGAEMKAEFKDALDAGADALLPKRGLVTTADIAQGSPIAAEVTQQPKKSAAGSLTAER